MFPFIRLGTYLQLYDFQIRIKYWMLQAGMRIWAEMPLSAIGLAILSLALHSHLKISGWKFNFLDWFRIQSKSWKFIKGFGPIANSNRLEYSTGSPAEMGKCLPWDFLDDPFDWRSWGAKLCIAYVSSNCVLFAQTRQCNESIETQETNICMYINRAARAGLL